MRLVRFRRAVIRYGPLSATWPSGEFTRNDDPGQSCSPGVRPPLGDPKRPLEHGMSTLAEI